MVRVRSVGICGTDLKIVNGEIPVVMQRVVGHEVLAEIEGPGAPGRRVLLDPAITCGSCTQCHEGRPNICTQGGLIGRDVDGGLQERIAVPQGNLVPIPDAIGDDVAPLVQVLSTCVHAQEFSTLRSSDRVAVIGLGVSGLLHIQLAKMRGVASVLCTTRSAGKLTLAGELGADVSIPADGREVDRIRSISGGGVEVVIDCVGSTATLSRAIDMCRPGGRIIAYGTIAQRSGELPFYDLYYKELVVASPRAATHEDLKAAVDIVASGHVDLTPLVSHRFGIDATVLAFQTAATSAAIKVMIDL